MGYQAKAIISPNQYILFDQFILLITLQKHHCVILHHFYAFGIVYVVKYDFWGNIFQGLGEKVYL